MKYKNNVLLVSGNIVSKMGSTLHNIALKSWLISISHNAALLGWISALTTIPMLLFNFVSGYLADTKNKKRIIVVTDFVSGIVCLLFALLVNVNKIYVPLILVVNITLAVCHSLFSPSLRALVPAIISKETIKKTNAVLSNLTELVKIVSPALTAYLLTIDSISIKTLFVINGVSFLLSSISEMFIDYRYKNGNSKSSVKDLFYNIKDGFYYLKSHTVLFKLIIFAMITNLFLSGYNVLLPYYGEVILRNSKIYGIALSFEAAGAIIASFFIYLSKKKEVDLNDIVKATIPQGLSLIIGAYPHSYALFISVFLFGYFLSRFNVLFFTYIQSNCDENYLGRVFSVIFTMAGVLMPLGDIIFGYVSSILANYTFVVIGGGILITTLFIFNKKQKVNQIYNP
ncbi:MFS transporter [Vallitalea guaymasensis]|uniref:MFS transporter n=1 Tax=Vallitalea guaymasensis TaxID=1185412 RepID=UPI000DE258CA|nr:MFS transporter [Vallitalea guaymasensis]